MANYRAEVNGKAYQVVLKAKSDRIYRVEIDGKTFDTELLTTQEQVMTCSVCSGSETVTANARIQLGDTVDVWLEGVLLSVSVQPLLAYPASGSVHPAQEIDTRIIAMMPGRVTSILASEGQSIESGTPLLILEAMKMQNEIRSPRAGRVRTVRVKQDEIVKKGATLVILE